MSSCEQITIISAVYPPEPVVSARMSQDLGKYLTEHGYRVNVLCPKPSRGGNYKNYQNSRKSEITIEQGIEIVRLPSYSSPHSKILARARESYSFGYHVCNYLSMQPTKPDVLYVNTWPIISQALIAGYSKKNKIPMILQIMDIYPESLTNKLNKFMQWLLGLPLTLVDTWIAKRASRIVVISSNMRNTYIKNRKIHTKKIKVINVWQDETLFRHLPKRDIALSHYNIPSSFFTFLYLGNIGPVAGVDFLIRAFHEAALPKAQLIIVGEGSDKSKCQQEAKRFRSSNIHFISDPIAENVPLLQSMADVFLLPLKKGAGMSSIPSKLAAYMFSGKPILATVDAESDTAVAITQAQCGWVGEPENVAWLADKMRKALKLSTNEITQLGKNARMFGYQHFSKTVGVHSLADLIFSCC